MIPALFKPMLAATLTRPELIKFPVYCSPKIDGIRCVVFDGVAYSRSLKPIPNPFVQSWVKEHAALLDGLDGELVVGSPTDPNCMQNTTSGVMKRSGEPDFKFFAFDVVLTGTEFDERDNFVLDQVFRSRTPRLEAVQQWRIEDSADMDRLEAQFLADGYEGMMVRRLDGHYKYGRSTEREGGLVKVKRFVDAEAVVIGFEEEMRNENEATRGATGRTERSTCKAGLVGKGTLGALVVRDELGRTFNIGSGFSAEQRAGYWQTPGDLLGRTVKFKYFDHGIKEVPRHPVFLGFRAPEDMST